MVETLQEVKGDMIKAGLKWNKRTHTLFVEVHLLECNTEVIANAGNIFYVIKMANLVTKHTSHGMSHLLCSNLQHTLGCKSLVIK